MKKLRHGWFIINGVQAGDRHIRDQIKGLQDVPFKQRTVLDIGCAEGLISKYCLDRGAALVHGIDIIRDNVYEAAKQCPKEHSHFWLMDCEDLPSHHSGLKMLKTYDVVLLLSVLHKLNRPDKLLHFVGSITDHIIIRLPAPIIYDIRSDYRSLDIKRFMTTEGFSLVSEPETSIEPVTGKPEWMSIWEKSIPWKP